MKRTSQDYYTVLQHPDTGKYLLEGWRNVMYNTRDIIWTDNYEYATKFNPNSVDLKTERYSFKFPWDREQFELLVPRLKQITISVTTTTEIVRS